MKKIVILLIGASSLILGCMIYLLRSGISLSPAVMIKPSHFSSEKVLAEAVVRRLFPQFNEVKHWQIYSPGSGTGKEVMDVIAAAHGDVEVVRSDILSVEEQLHAEGLPRLYIQRFSASSYDLSKECETMKRLNYKCLVEISLHKSRRKMKEDERLYFMMTSYLDHHFLVLVEK